jgi:translation initiation factor IF-3
MSSLSLLSLRFISRRSAFALPQSWTTLSKNSFLLCSGCVPQYPSAISSCVVSKRFFMSTTNRMLSSRQDADADAQEDRKQPQYLRNEQIQAKTVRVTWRDPSVSKKQNSVMPLHEARSFAKEKGLDLILITAEADPPVCTLDDYEQFRSELKEKEIIAKKVAKLQTPKELEMRCGIDAHDFTTKMNKTLKWIDEGRSVKIVVHLTRDMRGRAVGTKSKPVIISGQPMNTLDDITTQITFMLAEAPAMINQSDRFYTKMIPSPDQKGPPQVIKVHDRREFMISSKIGHHVIAKKQQEASAAAKMTRKRKEKKESATTPVDDKQKET